MASTIVAVALTLALIVVLGFKPQSYKKTTNTTMIVQNQKYFQICAGMAFIV